MTQPIKTFAEKLRAVRRAAGFSQAELARRVGLSVSSLSRFEARPAQRRLPDATTVRALAAALDLDPAELETPDLVLNGRYTGRLACRAGHSGWSPKHVAESAVIAGVPKVGQGTTIGHFAVLDASHGEITIGEDCEIGDGVRILTRAVRKNGNALTGSVKCGRNVVIGSNAVVLPGVELADGTVVLPGTTCGLGDLLDDGTAGT